MEAEYLMALLLLGAIYFYAGSFFAIESGKGCDVLAWLPVAMIKLIRAVRNRIRDTWRNE
jgi:hypothetical protein